jgi:P27 family predicted phage terminase small subunit
MRGRKPTPTALKLIAGNPGKRPLRLDEFKPYAEIPKAPKHLKGEALKEWKRVTSELHRYGMIAQVDRGALAMLCTCWARYVHAEEMIEKAAVQAPGSYGMFVKTPNNYAVQSPWLAVSNKAMEQYKVFCAEFGLTPSARSRMPVSTTQMPLFDVNAEEQKGDGTNGGPSKPPPSFGSFR